jgi:hypothetical protein
MHQKVSYEPILSAAEVHYHEAMEKHYDGTWNNVKKIEFHPEICIVGAGLGGGFKNTNKLHVMKYDQAMQSKDKEEWEKAVEEEHQ